LIRTSARVPIRAPGNAEAPVAMKALSSTITPCRRRDVCADGGAGALSVALDHHVRSFPLTRAIRGCMIAARALMALGALVVAGSATAAPPPAAAPLPRQPAELARKLVATTASLRASIDSWRGQGDNRPPADVTLYALYEQRLYRFLSGRDELANRTITRLPHTLASTARDLVTAHRELVRLTPPLRTRRIRVGPAEPAGDLLRWYREAQRRFGVSWRVLAAVNFVESAFGKLRNASAAGAQGPMQFMPSTWRKYGLGGDVRDPHDAILGAANYLRVSGASRNLRLALYAYNPSPLYVDAVLRYARQIGGDRHVFYELYSWQVYVRTRSGSVRVTGPGRQ
jgi:membrane-bound lytic murein transglycosylase B